MIVVPTCLQSLQRKCLCAATDGVAQAWEFICVLVVTRHGSRFSYQCSPPIVLFGLVQESAPAMHLSTCLNRKAVARAYSQLLRALPANVCTDQLELVLVLPLSRPSARRPSAASPEAEETAQQLQPMLTVRDVLLFTRRHRSTIYRWIRAGRFPAPRTHEGHPIGWARSDIEEWQAGKQPK